MANGLRSYAHYRDLGIAAASHGLAQAHVIRLIGPCNPAEVSKLHFHDVEFQMVYVLKGWVKTYMEGQGETLMKEGSSWTQPPRIKHLILDYSDNGELLEVILPAEFKTVELAASMTSVIPGRAHSASPESRYSRRLCRMDSGLRAARRPGMTDIYQLNTPTIAPIRQVVSVPETIDFNPSALISSRRSGAMVPRPPIMMPRLPKLAKPHIA